MDSIVSKNTMLILNLVGLGAQQVSRNMRAQDSSMPRWPGDRCTSAEKPKLRPHLGEAARTLWQFFMSLTKSRARRD
jgi:hypothetical protein